MRDVSGRDKQLRTLPKTLFSTELGIKIYRFPKMLKTHMESEKA